MTSSWQSQSAEFTVDHFNSFHHIPSRRDAHATRKVTAVKLVDYTVGRVLVVEDKDPEHPWEHPEDCLVASRRVQIDASVRTS